MAYEYPQDILFRHCDPARIVFFPRYFEMMNDCVEGFFAEVLHWPFFDVHKDHAVPTAQINCRFAAPSHHGDRLTLHLRVKRVGRTSVSYVMQALCESELRFETEATLVYVDKDGKPTVWPERIKQELMRLSKEE
jgi:4-hydroxybenzoyl-CoA thioesterase